jgi:hypothetical protein
LLINNRGGTTVKEGGNFGEGEKQTTDSRGESLRKTEEKRAKNRRAGRIFLKEKVRETERERPSVFFWREKEVKPKEKDRGVKEQEGE